ncbi:calcium load-activated calcium channel isoform 6-T7 [Molossus nigricans]
MSTMFADTLLIVFISVCTALLAEGITWVLVYRTDKYKRLKAEVEKQSKKLEKKKETITESAGRQQKKKIERQEEKLKNNNRDLSMVRMKSMFAIGFCFTALMGMFNSMTTLCQRRADQRGAPCLSDVSAAWGEKTETDSRWGQSRDVPVERGSVREREIERYTTENINWPPPARPPLGTGPTPGHVS